MVLTEALLEQSVRPRAGKFFALLNPILSPVMQPVLGRASQHYVRLLTEDLSLAADETNASGPDVNTLAILLVGTLHEALLKVAESPGRKAEMLEGISVLADGLLHSLRSAESKRVAG